MADNSALKTVPVILTPQQVAAVTAFQKLEALPTQADALRLLLDIALEAVTTPGRRFWDMPMPPAWTTRHVYTSSTGDAWHLKHDSTSGQMLVLHTPNAPSGGRASEVAVEEFLRRGGSGPEVAILRGMLQGHDSEGRG